MKLEFPYPPQLTEDDVKHIINIIDSSPVLDPRILYIKIDSNGTIVVCSESMNIIIYKWHGNWEVGNAGIVIRDYEIIDGK
jgi:hypothetical protein